MLPAIPERQVVVFETAAWWTPELRRQFLEEPVDVRQVTTPRAAAERLDASPLPVYVLNLDAGAADCVQLLARLRRRQPAVQVLVIGQPRMAELEWSVRELGAKEFIATYESGGQIARRIRRLWIPTVSSPGRA